MAKQELIDYIKNASNQNISKQDITQSLIQSGWQTNDIEDAFQSLENKDSIPMVDHGSLTKNKFSFSFKLPAFFKKGIIPVVLVVAILIGGYFAYQRLGGSQLVPFVSAGEGYVPVNLPIKIKFPHSGAKLEDIKANFSITPQVTGDLSFNDEILTFEHEKNLKYDTQYTIKISKGFATGFGKILQDDFVLTFTTRPRGEKRVLNLDSYSTFQAYNLNYYDQDYEIPLSALPGKYTLNVYKSSPEKMMEAYYNPQEYEKDGSIKRKSYAEGNPIDVQTLIANDKEANFVPKIETVGIYYVEVKAEIKPTPTPQYNYYYGTPVGDQSFFIVLTKTAITSKRLGDKLITWVVDQKTSAGLANITVKALGDKKDEIIYQESTNNQGLYEKVIGQDDSDKKPAILLVQNGNDVSFNFLNAQWQWNIYNSDYWNKLRQYRGYIYTDRPVYGPGDRINFKAIIRENDRVFYRPVQKEVTIRAREISYGEETNSIFEKKITSNSGGSLADYIDLSSEVKTGEYEISIELGDEVIGRSLFNVEFYQKPDFEIAISPDKEKYIKSQPIKAEISSSYFFGDPLKGAKVQWRVHGFYDETYQEGNVVLDNEGKASIEIPTNNIKLSEWGYGDYWGYYGEGINNGSPLTIEATITDKSGKTSVKKKVINIFDSEYGFSLSEPENLWNLKTGTTHKFVFKVVDNLTQNPKSGLQLKLVLTKNDWNNSKQQKNIIKTVDVTSNVSGEANFDEDIATGGSYELEVTTKDSLQNEVKKKFSFWVYEQDIYGDQQSKKDFADKIIVTLDKKSYKIGEKAKISLQLPRPAGDLLWSINKRTFKKISIDKLDGNKKDIEIEITEELAPGFYFYANIFQDDIFIEGKQLIEVTGKKLNITISSSKEKAGPAEEVELTIKTKDEDGNPVSAESSLSVVDKAIFALQSDQTTDIYDEFYEQPQDLIKSMDSLRVISVTLAEFGGCFVAGTKILMADGSLKNIEEVKVGDQILTRENKFSNKLVPDKVTKVFEHLVDEYLIIKHKKGTLNVTGIHPILVNDSWKNAEEIRVGDKLSNNLGEKVEVISIEKVKVNKPIKVYNFATFKYHTFFADSIYVHNACEGKGGGGEEDDCVRSNFVDTAYWNAFISTDNNGEAKVRFKLPDNLTTWVAFSRAVTQDTKVGQGQTEFKVTKDLIIRPVLPQFVRNKDTIQINASVHNNLGKSSSFRTLLKAQGGTIIDDSIKTVEVNNGEVKNISWTIGVDEHKSIKLTFTVEEIGGSAKDGVDLELPIYSNLSLSRDVTSGVGVANFNFSIDPASSKKYSSVVFSLTPSVLATLPQIIEKLTGFPYGCVEQTMSKHLPNILALKEKNTLGIELKEDYQKDLNEGYDRLTKYQHADGGFGWWETDENNVWMSGYVMEGLHEAKQAGLLNGREGIYNRLLEYLKKNVSKFSDEEKIYIDYVLSKVEPGSVKVYVEKFADEILAGKAYDIQSKGYIALALHNDGNSQKAKLVLDKILGELKTDHWDVADTYDYHGALKDKYSATGVNLLAIIKIDYKEQTAQKIIQWLMMNKNGYDGLWGSTRQSAQILFALVEYLKKTEELKPDYVYDIYLNGELLKNEKVNNNRYSLRLEIPMDKIRSDNSLEIKQNGKGNVYWSLLVNNYLPGDKITGENPDVKITREYLDLKGNPITKFLVGDLIKVRLRVINNKNLNYVLMEDFLPSALEPQNMRLENVGGRARFGDIYLGEWYDSLDIRDEKVAIFRRSLWSGTHVFDYLARVGYRGDFEAPAPHIEPMYSPEDFGFGSPLKINVK